MLGQAQTAYASRPIPRLCYYCPYRARACCSCCCRCCFFCLSLPLGCLVACHELMWLLFFRLLFLVVAAVRAIAEPVQPHKTFALHLVQISSQPCFHPFPPSRFSSSLPFTTDIFLDPGSWSVTVTVPCPFHPLLCPVLSCPILSCPALSCPACLACLLPCKCNHVHPIPWFEVDFFFSFSPKGPSSPSLKRIPWVWVVITVASHPFQGHAHHSISDLGISGIMNGPNSSCPGPLPSLPFLPHGMACASARAR